MHEVIRLTSRTVDVEGILFREGKDGIYGPVDPKYVRAVCFYESVNLFLQKEKAKFKRYATKVVGDLLFELNMDVEY